MTYKPDKEPFLARWSRRKHEAREEEAGEKPNTETSAAQEPGAEKKPDAQLPPPELPPVEKLDYDSDYRAFLDPRVDENTRRAALKKLFADARFNEMDGLDVYIDDYSRSESIPSAMLASLKQARNILEWARGDDRKSMGEPGDSAGEQAPRGGGPTDEDGPPALTKADEPARAASGGHDESAGSHSSASGGDDSRRNS